MRLFERKGQTENFELSKYRARSWACLKKYQKVILGNRAAICLGVTPKVANSDRDPVAGAEAKVQDLRHCQSI